MLKKTLLGFVVLALLSLPAVAFAGESYPIGSHQPTVQSDN
ncbi:hypothetical protein [Novibacillus thermophilus]|jgi:hypothetical protein|nr:hypothetical protein [Novibacillus thermophilus]